MEKKYRKAVRSFLIKDGKIVVIKYNNNNKDYIDIPGGKIENNETSEEASIREFKEETGITIEKQHFIGHLIIEYPNRIFDMDVFIVDNYSGKPVETAENESMWMDLYDLEKEDKVFPSIEAIKYLKNNLELKIECNENHIITKIMEKSTNKNGIIFDLDGTLWEVIDSTYNSANAITKKYKMKEIGRDTICKVFGLNKEEAAMLYFPNMELDEATKLIDEIAVINIENLKNNCGNIYSNVREVLDELSKKYDLYIISNTAEIEYIEAFFKTSNTKKYFKDYIAASSLKISKADAIKKVINDYKIKNAVYVGDTIIDYNSAKENDVTFIQAIYGFGENLNTEFSINSFDELPEVLEKIMMKK